jgi:hypothetical protein
MIEKWHLILTGGSIYMISIIVDDKKGSPINGLYMIIYSNSNSCVISTSTYDDAYELLCK